MWLKAHIYGKWSTSQDVSMSQDLKNLARRPSSVVIRNTSYSINGYTFYTRERDENHPVQNSGVTLNAKAMHIASAKDKNLVYGTMNYFGFIEDIWELDYGGLRIALFKCKWADNNYVKNDDDGITVVDFRRLGYRNDPFIMASQAIQVFYTIDPQDMDLSLVVLTKPRIVTDGEEVDEDCADIPSFTMRLPLVDEIDNLEDDVSYLLREDVEWIRIDEPMKKKVKR